MLKKAWVGVAVALFALSTIGCGGAGDRNLKQDTPLKPGFGGLPAFSAAELPGRLPSADPPPDPLHRQVLGMDFLDQCNCSVVFPALFLDGEANTQVAWALYAFDYMDGYTPQTLSSTVAPA